MKSKTLLIRNQTKNSNFAEPKHDRKIGASFDLEMSLERNLMSLDFDQHTRSRHVRVMSKPTQADSDEKEKTHE